MYFNKVFQLSKTSYLESKCSSYSCISRKAFTINKDICPAGKALESGMKFTCIKIISVIPSNLILPFYLYIMQLSNTDELTQIYLLFYHELLVPDSSLSMAIDFTLSRNRIHTHMHTHTTCKHPKKIQWGHEMVKNKKKPKVIVMKEDVILTHLAYDERWNRKLLSTLLAGHHNIWFWINYETRDSETRGIRWSEQKSVPLGQQVVQDRNHSSEQPLVDECWWYLLFVASSEL